MQSHLFNSFLLLNCCPSKHPPCNIFQQLWYSYQLSASAHQCRSDYVRHKEGTIARQKYAATKVTASTRKVSHKHKVFEIKGSIGPNKVM